MFKLMLFVSRILPEHGESPDVAALNTDYV